MVALPGYDTDKTDRVSGLIDCYLLVSKKYDGKLVDDTQFVYLSPALSIIPKMVFVVKNCMYVLPLLPTYPSITINTLVNGRCEEYFYL